MLYKGEGIYKAGGGYTPGDVVNNVVLGSGYAAETLSAATCEGSYIVTGANNNGSMTGTFLTVPVSFVLRRLGVHLLQGLNAAGFRLVVYTRAGVAVCRTAKFNFPATSAELGEAFFPVAEKWNGTAWEAASEITLEGGAGYYFGIFCPQSSSAARFLGKDSGNYFGPIPWLSWTIDNIGADAPAVLNTGYESSIRFMLLGAT